MKIENPENYLAFSGRAFKSLEKKFRELLAARILLAKELFEDWFDHVLMVRSRREKGRDVSFEDFIEQRK